MTDHLSDNQDSSDQSGLLAQVTEHMEVVGSDHQPLGKVDKVHGDTVVLTKTDSADGRHHSFASSMIDRVEGDKLILNATAEEAREQFGDPDRDRSLAETDDQGESGPHVLNKSFSGTY
jgi:hypothetical protein